MDWRRRSIRKERLIIIPMAKRWVLMMDERGRRRSRVRRRRRMRRRMIVLSVRESVKV